MMLRVVSHGSHRLCQDEERLRMRVAHVAFNRGRRDVR